MCPAAHPPTILKFFLFSLSSVRCTQFFLSHWLFLKYFNKLMKNLIGMLQLCRPFASIPLSFCLFAPPAIAAHVVTPLRAQEPWKAQDITGFTSNFKTFPTLFGDGLRMEKTNLGQKRSKGEAGWSTSSNCSVKKLQVVKGPIKLRHLLFHISFFQHLPFPSKCYIFFVIPLIGL